MNNPRIIYLLFLILLLLALLNSIPAPLGPHLEPPAPQNPPVMAPPNQVPMNAREIARTECIKTAIRESGKFIVHLFERWWNGGP